MQLGMNFGQLRSAEIPRLIAAAGFNWIFLDTEHGSFDFETVQDMCRVAKMSGLCPLVRPAGIEYSIVARSLDCGAQGIIFPRMEDPRLLETALSWARYPPVGTRGYGLQPNQLDYEKKPFSAIIDHVNANTLTVLQIETQKGVEARDEILSVPGLDAVMIGPADLSIALGVPGEFEHPKLIAAMEAIRDTCISKGIAPGTHTRSVAMARFWKERGMRFLGCGSEIMFLAEKTAETARAVFAD